MRDFAVEGQRFDRTVRTQQDGAAGRLVAAARFHADIAVFDQIEPAHAVLAAEPVEFGQQRSRAELLAVDRDRIAMLEIDLDQFGFCRRFVQRRSEAPHVIRRRFRRVLEHAALIGDVQQIGVHGIGRLALALFVVDRDAVLVGIGHQLVARQQVPFAPGCDHLDVGHQRVGAKFEANLIVALAGGAVRNRIGLFAPGDLDQTLGNQRTGDGGSQQIFAFVEGVGAKHRKHEVTHELFAQVFDVDLFYAEFFGLGTRRLELFTLTDIGGEGDDLASVGVLQPFEDHRGVEATGIGENYFLDLGHGVSGVRLKRAKLPFCQLMRRVRSGCMRQSTNARAVYFA